MSYEKVKSIRITGHQVFIKSKCNNDTEPVRELESSYLTKILLTEGVEAAQLSIMKAYEEGNFQSTAENKYTNALRCLHENPEYEKFNWRNKTYKEGCMIEAARESAAFDEILKQALNTKIEKQKIIVTKKFQDETIFLQKVTITGSKWTRK